MLYPYLHVEVEADTALFFLGLSTLLSRSQVIWGKSRTQLVHS